MSWAGLAPKYAKQGDCQVRRTARRQLFVACVIGLIAAKTHAEDFTFRTVTPPPANAERRITIQVEQTWPHEVEEPVAAAPQEASPAIAPGPHDWFWAAISPDLEAADAIRLDRSLTVLANHPQEVAGLNIDRQMIEAIMRAQGQAILAATAGKRVSPALVLAMIAVESGGRTDATSPIGARGLMQLMPATASRFGAEDPNDPIQNISAGAEFLDLLLGQFKGDPILSLAGYNAGENAVREHNGVPPFPETRAFVPKVLAAWDMARMYCKTLPRRVDDGCVFAFERSLVR